MTKTRLRVDKHQRVVDDEAIRKFIVAKGKGVVGEDITEEDAITWLISLTHPLIVDLHARNIKKFIKNCHNKGSRSMSVNLKGWLHNISKSKKFQWALDGADPVETYLKTMRIVCGTQKEPTKLDFIAAALRQQKREIETHISTEFGRSAFNPYNGAPGLDAPDLRPAGN